MCVCVTVYLCVYEKEREGVFYVQAGRQASLYCLITGNGYKVFIRAPVIISVNPLYRFWLTLHTVYMSVQSCMCVFVKLIFSHIDSLMVYAFEPVFHASTCV